MILIAGGFGGVLDISSPELLGDTKVTEFRRAVRSGDIVVIPDYYVVFPNIRNAITLGYLSILGETTISGIISTTETILVTAPALPKRVVRYIVIANKNVNPTSVNLYTVNGDTSNTIWNGILDPDFTFTFGSPDANFNSNNETIILNTVSMSIRATSTSNLTYTLTYEDVSS